MLFWNGDRGTHPNRYPENAARVLRGACGHHLGLSNVHGHELTVETWGYAEDFFKKQNRSEVFYVRLSMGSV